MSKPPSILDGANVIFWSWSVDTPFFVMPDGASGIAIYGLAICQYSGNPNVYRFSCNESWEVENDTLFETIAEAMNNLSGQYQIELVKWQKY